MRRPPYFRRVPPRSLHPTQGKTARFEYEARAIVGKAGVPTTNYGFTTAEQARKIAEDIGGPTVIKSQV